MNETTNQQRLVLVQFGQWGITTQLQNRGAVATGSSRATVNQRHQDFLR